MEIRFRTEGPDQQEVLQSLLGWLTDDRALRGLVQVQRTVTDRPGRMGPELDSVLAVISTAVGVLQLPLSYLAWRQSRRPTAPPVTIQVVGADQPETGALLRRLQGESPDNGSSDEPGT
ncbi:hypothetical protein ACFU96_31660 [Streptomyces sp. NPDC057620]|uniref:Uncharacterized protein n=1 Tax=Streptomyces liliiviolaceus TaxID=2823109 RepID=A0A940Y7V1_9ACTN|nr:hypothetical protein [Streptomyces liliiviolaceus]MBQ0854722.1 hypothetical protein [Streptomyces liliiviolaceus]